MYNNDLASIADLVKIVSNNKIEVCDSKGKKEHLAESLFQPTTTRASSLMRQTFQSPMKTPAQDSERGFANRRMTFQTSSLINRASDDYRQTLTLQH